jgi:hypothetical protein
MLAAGHDDLPVCPIHRDRDLSVHLPPVPPYLDQCHLLCCAAEQKAMSRLETIPSITMEASRAARHEPARPMMHVLVIEAPLGATRNKEELDLSLVACR